MIRISLVFLVVNIVYVHIVAPLAAPLIVSSDMFFKKHRPYGYHPENEDRISLVLDYLKSKGGRYNIVNPSAEGSESDYQAAVKAIKRVHNSEYIEEVKERISKGAIAISVFDSDTYLTPSSYDISVLAQSAWLDCLKHAVSKRSFAFALTRPPGHHARRDGGMGFCLFNFAAATAAYAIDHKLAERVAIFDFDVHYGNGCADIVKREKNIRYASLHQGGIFPNPPEPDGILHTAEFGNVLTVNMKAGFTIKEYMPPMMEKAVPFLKEFDPQVLIVCAGFDALFSDHLANGNFQVTDYTNISKWLKDAFGESVAILYGLEGGYNLYDLPKAIEAAMEPFCVP